MSARFETCAHPHGSLGVHCKQCDPRDEINQLRAQRDLAMVLVKSVLTVGMPMNVLNCANLWDQARVKFEEQEGEIAKEKEVSGV